MGKCDTIYLGASLPPAGSQAIIETNADSSSTRQNIKWNFEKVSSPPYLFHRQELANV